MLVLEELFLLLMDNDGIPEVDRPRFACAVTAGAFLDLMAQKHISVSSGIRPRIYIENPTPPKHPVLGPAFGHAMAFAGKRVTRLLAECATEIVAVTGTHLAQSELVTIQPGLLHATRYTNLDKTVENTIRERLAQTICAKPPTRMKDIALLNVIVTLDCPLHVLGAVPNLKDNQLKDRIRQLVTAHAPAQSIALVTAARGVATSTDRTTTLKDTPAEVAAQLVNRLWW